jgi:mono/diheme cytochrome c family protein
MKSIKHLFVILLVAVLFESCSPPNKDFAGSEYMPDMGHSVAYEANVYNYYYYNTWDSLSTFRLKELSMVRPPVAGTVPRGYAGIYFAGDQAAQQEMTQTLRGGDAVNSIAVPVNGHVPYYYDNTEDERLRATAEITNNPFPISAADMARGKELYTTFCAICHGDKGDGNGYLVSEENPNAKYPVVPANFLTDEFVSSSNGRYYHSIMYGKNVMGSYKDKISYEERWQVIHYIRSLQAKDRGLAYNEEENTLNVAFGTPKSQIVMPAVPAETAVSDAGEAAHDNEGHSSGGGGH